jgi:hypothetical protein
MLRVKHPLPLVCMELISEGHGLLDVLLHTRQHYIGGELGIRTFEVDWWLCILYMEYLVVLGSPFTLVSGWPLLAKLHQ